jgi:hypothetical protein
MLNKKCKIALETLLDYQEGRLDAAATAQMQTHISGCAACTAQLAAFGRLLPSMREAHQYHAPESALERARALYRERFQAAAAPSLSERIALVAQLLFDGRQSVALAGARGEAGESFHLVYGAEGVDLDLWQERETGGAWATFGQALRADGEAMTPESVSLQGADGVTRAATLEGSDFHLDAVPPGRYRLEIELPGAQVVVPELSIGAEV